MIKIILDDKYILTSDRYNYKIGEYYTKSKDDLDGLEDDDLEDLEDLDDLEDESNEKITIIKNQFYGTLDGALKGYVDRRVKNANIKSFKELSDEIKKIKKIIDNIQKELFESN